MNDRADLFIDTLWTAVTILAMTLGPVLAVTAVFLAARAILKRIKSST